MIIQIYVVSLLLVNTASSSRHETRRQGLLAETYTMTHNEGLFDLDFSTCSYDCRIYVFERTFGQRTSANVYYVL
jgi:hypothetical protein